MGEGTILLYIIYMLQFYFVFKLVNTGFILIVLKNCNDISTTARARSMDVLPSSLVTDKNDGNFALVKSGSGKVKTTPAGEYLTAALNEFNPDQYEGVAAISDGANKLLMLVWILNV